MSSREWAAYVAERESLYRAQVGPWGLGPMIDMETVRRLQLAEKENLRRKKEEESRREVESANAVFRAKQRAGTFTFNLSLISLEDFQQLKRWIVGEHIENKKAVFVYDRDQSYGELNFLFPVWKGVTRSPTGELRDLRERGRRGTSSAGKLLYFQLRSELWGLCETHLSDAEWDVVRSITGLFNAKTLRPTPEELPQIIDELREKYDMTTEELSAFYLAARDKVELEFYKSHTSPWAQYRGNGRVDPNVIYMP